MPIMKDRLDELYLRNDYLRDIASDCQQKIPINLTRKKIFNLLHCIRFLLSSTLHAYSLELDAGDRRILFFISKFNDNTDENLLNHPMLFSIVLRDILGFLRKEPSYVNYLYKSADVYFPAENEKKDVIQPYLETASMLTKILIHEMSETLFLYREVENSDLPIPKKKKRTIDKSSASEKLPAKRVRFFPPSDEETKESIEDTTPQKENSSSKHKKVL